MRLPLPLVFSVALVLPHVAAVTSIIFPLYFDPDPNTCWPELQAAAKANPTVPFILILNPQSGPVKDITHPQIQCIPKLRAAIPKVKLIGYVSTNYGKRSATLVKRDIAAYKVWSSYKVGGKAAGVDGVFLDEVHWDASDKKILALYTTYSKLIRSTWWTKPAKSVVVFNPGTKVGAGYYPLADIVISFENPYSAYTSSSVSSVSSTPLSKQGIMIHSFPTTSVSGKTPTQLLTTVVTKLVPGAGAIFVTNLDIKKVDVYKDFGSNWKTFTALVGKRNKVVVKREREVKRGIGMEA